MRLLLDTHIWLWSILDPTRLTRRVATVMTNPGNEIWLSPISVWEVMTLCRKGRLALEPDAGTWVTAVLSRIPFKQAPVTHEIAAAMDKIALEHNDPADRFLAATAMVHGLTLVTS